MVNLQAISQMVKNIEDPELVGITIDELGFVGNITDNGAEVIIELSPSYLGCTAFDAIKKSIHELVDGQGAKARFIMKYDWNTDKIKPIAHEKMQAMGMAPPNSETICPRCLSHDVRFISYAAGALCQSAHQCKHCSEFFTKFRCHT